jgi:alkylation response protein AidB-like acyl-CoA dehydrogenase
MPIGITEEHEALRQSVRSWVNRQGGTRPAREALEEVEDRLPGLWRDLVSLGWLGLHVQERYGGSGYTLTELAVVVEELGRVCLPGPFLPTALAAALVQAGGGGNDLLRRLADGTTIATVDLEPGRLSARRRGDGWLISGATHPLLSGGVADVVVAPVGTSKGELWVVLPRAAATVESLPSTDATRRVARWHWEEHPLAAEDVLADLDACQVRRYASTLLAAEAAGIAGWCLDTAVEYAKIREQFGRPIGQFQAIKHRAADMLARVEMARAIAWDAARAVDDGPEQMDVAAALAAALVPDFTYTCARQCIQMLGGIGFTWEHDAHIFLKRALVSFQLLGGTRTGRVEVGANAVAGRHRALTLRLPEEAATYRAQARGFFDSIVHLDMVEQRRRMADAGYLMPHLPRPWGLAADAVQQLVIDEERERAGVEHPFLANASFVVPTLIRFGSPRQQELIGPSLRGELGWCQLFSEPGAGSDLASLSTKAVKVPGGWSITGQKIWTTRAHVSDYGICLARTDPNAERHRGITYFLMDMAAKGVEVRSLIELNGNHHFNQVFLADVFVPDEHVVGEVNDGWRVARTTLGFERVAMGSRSTLGDLAEKLAGLLAAREELRSDPGVLQQAGYLIAVSQAAALMRLRSTMRAIAGAQPGPEVSLLKVVVNENQQQLAEYGLELLALEGLAREGVAVEWLDACLYARCLTIAGGTSEIQRNVIAQRLLGLPRDP